MNHAETSAKNVNGIIMMLAEISEKLNLLSLNASIEAARSGVHGKGFSVVATEINKLADNATENTKKASSLLKELDENIKKGLRRALFVYYLNFFRMFDIVYT